MRDARWLMVVGCVACVACGGDDAPTPDAGGGCARACDDGLYCNGAERCDPSAESADEAGCVRGAPPCGESACDDVADACDVDCAIPDADGDGDPALACGGGDCNDADPRVSSTRTEVCDEENLDEDCDPGTVGGRDLDGDGSIDARCCNGSACGTDCDDARPNVNPTTTEVCDGFDNDCDGSIDEGVLVTFYRDADGDDFGTPIEMRVGCTAPDGFARTSTDCDDTNAGRNPGLAEVCDAIPDNDCNPTTNPFDADGDGHDRASCGGTDCDDTDDTVYLGAPELCDRRDNACNFGGGVLVSEDADEDGHAPIGAACVGGLPKDDCDDSRPEVFLGAEEVCSGRDEDCDGSTDEDPAAMASCNRTGTVGACVEGACTIAACMSPYANCNGIANDGCEANLDSSTSHCGGCGVDCAAGASCVGRSCRCPVGMVVCNGACVDLQTDARHCGECGDACPFGAVCETSTCRCPFGQILCDGECVDPNSDVRHCGGCGATCFGGSCAGGSCECPGAVGTLCGGECFDLSVDLDHCGACDEGCRGGSCAGGACSCPPGRPTVCEGTCTNTIDDRARCGDCDTACGLSQCVSGACDPIVDVASESRTTCVVLASGRLYCWGYNLSGQVGDGTAITRFAPVSILSDALRVDVSESHSCAVRVGGGVSCWGANDSGQLGLGAGVASPVPVVTPTSRSCIDVEVGLHSSCCLRADGSVECWGTLGGIGGAPREVEEVTEAVEVEVGSGTACVRRMGRVSCFGLDQYGELGDGGGLFSGSSPPVDIGLDSVVELASGWKHFCARRTDGSVWCWGSNQDLQLGNGTGINATAPVRANVTDALHVAAGVSSTCIARVGGEVVCFGLNLPIGTFPVRRDVDTLAPGYAHLCIRSRSGALECAGSSDYGEVGNGVGGGGPSWVGPIVPE